MRVCFIIFNLVFWHEEKNKVNEHALHSLLSFSFVSFLYFHSSLVGERSDRN